MADDLPDRPGRRMTWREVLALDNAPSGPDRDERDVDPGGHLADREQSRYERDLTKDW